MKTLNFDTGIVSYSLNDKCEIHINPTDTAFINRTAETFEAVDALSEKYAESFKRIEHANSDSPAEIFDLCERRNAEARKLIDELFGGSVCDAVFGEMDVFALANGLPVWQNLFFAILEEMDTSALSEKSKTKSRLDKYIAKYRK